MNEFFDSIISKINIYILTIPMILASIGFYYLSFFIIISSFIISFLYLVWIDFSRIDNSIEEKKRIYADWAISGIFTVIFYFFWKFMSYKFLDLFFKGFSETEQFFLIFVYVLMIFIGIFPNIILNIKK